MKNKSKTTLVFVFQNYGNILKVYAGSFHQAQTSYFWWRKAIYNLKKNFQNNLSFAKNKITLEWKSVVEIEARWAKKKKCEKSPPPPPLPHWAFIKLKRSPRLFFNGATPFAPNMYGRKCQLRICFRYVIMIELFYTFDFFFQCVLSQGKISAIRNCWMSARGTSKLHPIDTSTKRGTFHKI